MPDVNDPEDLPSYPIVALDALWTTLLETGPLPWIAIAVLAYLFFTRFS